MKIKKEVVILFVIMTAGLLLRLYNLPFWNLSSDEAFCVRVAGLNYFEIIQASANDVHPPFYYFLLHNWILLLGNSEFVVRSFSALFGTMAIFLLYLLGKVLFNNRVGIIGAVIMSVSVFNIDYSQKARMYTLLLFLSLFSVYLYSYILKKSKEENYNKFYYSLFFINILLLYTHLYGSLIILIELSWLLFLYIKNRNWSEYKALVFTIIASSITFIPWIFVVIKAKAERSTPWLDVPSFLEIANRFAGSNYLLVFFIPFFILPLLWKKIRNRSVLFLYTAVFFLVVFPYLVATLFYPSFQARYIIFASAICYLLVAYAFNSLKPGLIKISIVTWVLVLALFALNDYYSGPDNADWRGVSSYLDQQASSQDLLIFTAGYTLKNGFDYYSHRNDLSKIPFPKLSERISLPVDDKNILELDPILEKKYSKIWVIYHEHRDYNDLIIQKLSEYGYAYAEDKEFNDAQIFEFLLTENN